MKFLLSFLLFSFLGTVETVSFAQETDAASVRKGFICQSDLRDVKVQVVFNENQLKLNIQVPMGYKYLPQFDGISTISDLPWLKYQAEQLAPLGDQFSVIWPILNCRYKIVSSKAETRVECNGDAVSSVNEIGFHSLSISRLTESTFDHEYHTRRLRLVVSRNGVNGQDLFYVSIPVAEDFCADYE